MLAPLSTTMKQRGYSYNFKLTFTSSTVHQGSFKRALCLRKPKPCCGFHCRLIAELMSSRLDTLCYIHLYLNADAISELAMFERLVVSARMSERKADQRHKKRMKKTKERCISLCHHSSFLWWHRCLAPQIQLVIGSNIKNGPFQFHESVATKYWRLALG